MMKKILAAMLVLCTLATSFSSLAVGVSAARSVQLDEAVNEQLAAEAADIESAMPDRAGALAGAQSGKCGDDLTWTLDDNGTLTVSGTGAMYDYTYSYTSTPWYAYRNTIKKIVISSGVTGIGGYAFRNHTSLETVTMADSVTVINNGAFDKCTSLVSVTIGNAVTRLGDYCFNDCESLVSVSIPASVKNIGGYAFSNCTSLVSIGVDSNNQRYATLDGVLYNKKMTTLVQYPAGNQRSAYTVPASVTSIGVAAFAYCSNLEAIEVDGANASYASDNGVLYNADMSTLIQYPVGNHNTSFAVPDSVTAIADYSFYNCTFLADITLPDSVASIGVYAFDNTAYYNNTANWDGNVLYIGNHLIKAKTTLSGSYTVKSGTVTVADYAFSSCSKLTNIVLDNSVVNIGTGIFAHCTALENVTIGTGAVSIGNYAFYKCTALTDVYYNSTEEDWAVIKVGIGNECLSASTIHYTVPVIVEGVCGDDLTWVFNSVEGTLTISGTGEMYDYSNEYVGGILRTTAPWKAYTASVRSIFIGDDVTSIGDYAFYNFESVSDITLDGSVTRIGNGAFEKCVSLKNVVIGDSVVTVGDTAFSGCVFLSSLNIGDSVTAIGDSAFEGCVSLKNVNLGSSVETVGAKAFKLCESLAGISIPASLKTVGADAFVGCNALAGVYITDLAAWCGIGFNSEKSNPLTYAKKLYLDSTFVTDLVIPSSVKNINNYAFYNCSSLKTVNFGTSVKTIGSYAFYGCTGLGELTIPASVTAIGEKAFQCYMGGYRNLDITIVCVENSYAHTYAQNNGFKYKIYGSCGDNLTWTFVSSTGTLTILGEGDMYNYENAVAPWASFASSVKSVVIGNGVTGIGDYAFMGCDALTSVNIPASVAKLGAGAFYECTALKSVAIPESVETIDYYTFYGCTSLVKVTLPVSVTTVGYAAFYDCTSLADVYYSGLATQWAEIFIDEYNEALTSANLHFLSPIIARGDCGDGVVWTLNEDGVLTVSGEGKMTDYTSESYNGTRRTTAPWKIYASSIKSVVIESGVESIGTSAFCYCPGLESVTVADTVVSVGEDAFSNCTSLKDITLPVSIRAIGNNAFYNTAYYNTNANWTNNVLYIGRHLIKANLPISGTCYINSGTVTIANNAFANCQSLTGVSIPSSVITIGDNAFAGCVSLGKVVIPNSVTRVGNSAFLDCASLDSVTIGTSVDYIGSSAFAYCYSLTSISIPDSVTTIGDNAFEECSELADITLPDSLTSIGENAFNYTAYFNDSSNWESQVLYIGNHLIKAKRALKSSYYIKDGTLTIADSAFYGCNLLTSVTMPESVRDIGKKAFFNCTTFADVSYGGSEEQWLAIRIGEDNDPLNSANIKYASSKLCGDDVTWSLDDDGTFIISGTGPMYEYTKSSQVPWHALRSYIKSVIVTEGVTSVTDYAFYECTNLTDVVIADSVTDIGMQAFCYCYALNDIYIGRGVVDLGSYLFYDCTALTSITIPDSVKTIGAYAFRGCTALANVYMGRSVESIGNWCFRGCSAITSITLPNTLVSIGNHAFRDCNGLTKIVIPDSVTTIGNSAFYDAKGLTTVVIGDSVTVIPENCFYGCNNLKYINFGSSVTTISSQAFCYNYALKDLVVPDTVTEIGELAFYECSSLGTVTLGAALKTIGGSAFNLCENIYRTVYKNTSAEWAKVSIGTKNEDLFLGKFYTLDNHEHEVDSWIVAVYPSCTDEGLKQSICTLCDAVAEEVIPALGHAAGVETAIETVAPTCTENGYVKYLTVCDRCDVEMGIRTATLFAKGHTMTSTVVAPTCAEEGYTLYKCSVCEESYKDNFTEKTEHTYGAWETVNKATCAATGEKQAVCTVCGDTKTSSIPKTPHKYTSQVIKPTYFEDGYTLYTCSGCGNSYTANTVPAYERTDINNAKIELEYTSAIYRGEPLTPAVTLTYEGESYDVSTELKITYTDNDKAGTAKVTVEGINKFYGTVELTFDVVVEHEVSDWIIEKEATATEDGLMIKVCLICGEVLEADIIPALGVKYVPELSTENYTVKITNGEHINHIRYASGVLETASEIKNAPDRVDINKTVVTENLVDGNYVRVMSKGGVYSFWVKMDDGSTFIMVADLSVMTPEVTADGVMITVHNLYGVKDVFIAKGDYASYSALKGKYIVRLTAAKMAGKHSYTYTVSDPGVHTVCVRFDDSSRADMIFKLDLKVTEPVFTPNGLQLRVDNLEGVKVIRTVYGDYTTSSDIKQAGSRNFTSKYDLKGLDSYTIQYRENGKVSVAVEYYNGYIKIYQYDIQKKTPTWEVKSHSVIFGNLDDLYVIRYAPGTYKTSNEIKNAPNSKVIRASEVTGKFYAVIGLSAGTYTFCVQYNDDSYNYINVVIN